MKAGRFTRALPILLLFGCASAPGPLPPLEDMEQGGIPITVVNDTPASLRVSALHGGQEVPLGRADALSQLEARLPAGLIGGLRLIVRPTTLADTRGNHTSEQFLIYAGQRVVWELRTSPGVSDLPRFSTVRVLDCGDLC